MTVITNPQKYQCALLKSSRKHYENAIESYADERNVSGHLTAAIETAENAGDAELMDWLVAFKPTLESGSPDTSQAASIVLRYNEYNAKCAWGLPDFDATNPLIVPGGDDSDL